MKKILLILSSVFIFTQILDAQNKVYFSKDSLRKDIAFLYEKIRELHPDPFMNTSHEAFISFMDSISNNLKDNETKGTFYFKIASLVATIKDGHTTVLRPAFDSQRTLIEGNKIFPIDIHIQNGKFYAIYDNFHNDSITGEILSINDIHISKIAKPILNACSFERDEDINYNTIERDFFLLLSELCTPDSIYKIKLTGEKPSLYITNGISADKLKTLSRYTNIPEPYKLLIENNSNVATIKFENFIPSEKIYNFIDSAFSVIQMKNIDTLYFDVRGNTGGSSDVVSKIISHLISQKYKIYDKYQVKISPFIKEYFQKRDAAIYNAISNMKTGTIYKIFPVFIKGDENIYKGKVVVLSNRRTYSGASTFAHLIKNLGIGKVVGEIGSNEVYFGDFTIISLPYSKISVAISIKKFYEWRSENPKKSRK